MRAILGRRTPRAGSTTSFFVAWSEENAAAVPPPAPLPSRPPRRRLRPRHAVAAVATCAAGASLLLPSTTASADPSSTTWNRLRMCESGNNYSINTGNDHYGAYQFDVSTWRSVGGTGLPSSASKAEQDARALILYRERGWQPWQCASILGLSEDSDAGSGRTSDIKVSSGGSSGGGNTSGSSTSTGSTSGVPAFPGGSHWYVYGDWNNHIKQFQDQMHKRGYFPVGTGQYGSNTLRMVKQLQRLNGLVPNGYIGPNTWRLAWTGKYHETSASKGGSSTSAIPAFPGGSHWYVYGDWNNHIKQFQDQMHKRGYFPVGTGQYGSNTLRMVKQLQRLNGLVPNGYIGPNTWRLAWTGKYRMP